MISVKCLHCDSDNDPRATGGYCDSCGKKLPPASGFQSRRIIGAGSTDESPSESIRPRRQTAEAVFTAAVLALIGGGLFLVLGPVFLQTVPERFAPAIMLLTVLGMVWNGVLGLGSDGTGPGRGRDRRPGLVSSSWPGCPSSLSCWVGRTSWACRARRFSCRWWKRPSWRI